MKGKILITNGESQHEISSLGTQLLKYSCFGNEEETNTYEGTMNQ